MYSGGVGSSCEGRAAVKQRDAALVVACHRCSKVMHVYTYVCCVCMCMYVYVCIAGGCRQGRQPTHVSSSSYDTCRWMQARAAANHEMPCKLYHGLAKVLVLSHELPDVVAFCVCHLIACSTRQYGQAPQAAQRGRASVRAGGCELSRTDRG